MENKTLPTNGKASLIYEGATVSELKYMFGKTHSDIKAALDGLAPTGHRGAFAIYSVREAAKRIVTPDVSNEADLIERIAKLSPDKLPDKLRKSVWDAKIAQQTFETRSKDLWPTEDIVTLAGDAFKAMRLSLLLFPDTLEREAGMNERQRQVVQRLVDGILDDMRSKLVDVFQNRRDTPGSEPDAPEEDDSEEEL